MGGGFDFYNLKKQTSFFYHLNKDEGYPFFSNLQTILRKNGTPFLNRFDKNDVLVYKQKNGNKKRKQKKQVKKSKLNKK